MKHLKLHPLALASLSGILIGFSYIPGPIVLSWIAFVPFFFFLQTPTTMGQSLRYAWLTQFLLTLIGFHWIGYTISEFGQMPWYLGYLGLIGFCCFANLHFVLATFIFKKVVKHPGTLSMLWFSLIFVSLEIFFPMIFPWNMGYTWIPSMFPLKQLADSVGVFGLSLITLLINVCIFSLLQKPSKRVASIAVVVFVSLNAVGYFKAKAWEGGDRVLRALVVQANIGNLLKYKAEKEGKFQTEIINEYLDMTFAAVKEQEVDLIVWPETAMPIFLNLGRMDSMHTKRIADLARISNADIFTGVYSYTGEDIYNSTAFITKQGLVSHIYNKHILLAFGEYFPGTESSPYLKNLVEKIVPAVSHFARGAGPSVMKVQPNFVIGPQVCYEGLDPFYNQKIVEQGANLLINVTNDSWFGTTFEPYQHMYMTLARAIELRRPLIRSTNTGISAAITASGEILELSPMMEKWSHVYEIPIRVEPEQSLYAISASLQSYLLLILSLVMAIISKRRKWL